VITVILSFPNQQRQEVLLAGVPHRGELIRLANGKQEPSLIVTQVLWMEGTGGDTEPQALCVVEPYSSGPKL
jgi:hypothetical protein